MQQTAKLLWMHFLAALFLFAMCVCVWVCVLLFCQALPLPLNPFPITLRSSILYAAAFCCSCCCCTYENEKLSDRRPNGANNTEHSHTRHTHSLTHTYLHTYCHWQLVERALRGRTRVKGVSNASRGCGGEVMLDCRDCGYVFTSLRCGYVTCNWNVATTRAQVRIEIDQS